MSFLGALGALVGFAVLVGYESYGAGKLTHGQHERLVSGALAHAFALTVTRPAVALPVAFGLLVFMGWFYRRRRLASLVWRGGPVFVPDFQTGSKLDSVLAPNLTAQFRERLAVLRLQAATPSPGAAPEGAFLDILTSGETTSGNILGPLLRLLRAAVPSHALEVKGMVREKPDKSACCVTVQVLQTPSQSSSVIEVADTSWERAIRRAADEATAAILPRSSLCRGTWAAWRGYVMPEGLLSAYEDAAKFEQERRFDEALDRYWEALRHDPTNLSVRLRLGQLQEKMGLLLAALTSYQRILAFANPGAKNLPRGMYRRGARREWDRALSVAKYRATILLGEGSIVRLWSQSRSETHVIPYRERLHKEYLQLLPPLAGMIRRDPAADAISRATRELLEVGPRMKRKRERAVREKLIDYAMEAANELRLTLPRWESRAWSGLLTRRTVALSQLSIERHRDLLHPSARVLDDRGLRALDRRITRAGWHPGPLTGWWPTWLRRWQWHEHYNAACVYAAYLDSHQAAPAMAASTHKRLAQRAVKRLERAITTRDSEFVITWRDWVISEDHALDSLRKQPEFRSFEAMYFPSHAPATVVRPRLSDPQRLAEIRCTRDLLAGLARSRHHAWHDRASDGALADDHALSRWCEAEREIWALVGKTVGDCYDWRLRRNLLQRANALLPDHAAFFVAFSRYEEKPPVGEGEDHASDAINELRRAEARLGAVGLLLAQPNGAGAGNHSEGALYFERWTQAMRDYSAHDVTSHAGKARLCNHNAAVWQKLSEWLRAGEEEGALSASREAQVQAAYGELVTKLREAESLWRQASSGRGRPLVWRWRS